MDQIQRRATSVLNSIRKLENESVNDTRFKKEDKVLGTILCATIKARLLRFGLEWMHRCSFLEKRGLKVLGWVVKHQGEEKVRHKKHVKKESK
jgi:hypothetical protein